MPPSTSTCLNAPPPPIISSIIAICLTDSVIDVLISDTVFLRANPIDQIEKSKESSIAASGAPTTWMASFTGLLSGRMKEQIVAMAIRMTGIMAVSTEMAKPGVSSSLNSLKSPSTAMSMFVRYRSGRTRCRSMLNSGPATMVVPLCFLV